MREQATWTERGLAPIGPKTEERRSSARVPSLRAVALVQLVSGGETQRAEFRDVSAFGAGLVMSSPVPTRGLLLIRFRGAARSVLGRVAHNTPVPGGWLAGCAFVTELDDEGMRPFGVPRVPAPVGDARRWVRFPCDVSARVVPQAAGAGGCVSARVLDASAGGVGMVLPRSFPQGTLLGLALSWDAPPLPLRVVRSERAKDGWFFGCEFAGRLAQQELDVLCGGTQARPTHG
jgi:hypothetical protein